DAVAGELAQRPARPVHAADAAQPRARPGAAEGRPDRPAPRPGPQRRLLRAQPGPGAGHARGAPQGRAGDAAAQPPRLLDPRPLPQLRLRRGVSLLRPGADVPPRTRRDAVPLLRLRAGAAAALPAVRPAGGTLPGAGDREAADRDRGEVPRPRRAP